MKQPVWTVRDKQLLEKHYSTAKKEELMLLFKNRTWDAIQIQAGYLKIRRQNSSSIKNNVSILLEDTPETYYWIGFLLADGYFSENRIKLKLAEKDKEHVLKFAKFIKFSGNRTDKQEVSAMDNFIVPKIREKFDIKNRKTYEPCKIDWIKDENLFLSLTIGFIDGDGSVRQQTGRKDCLLTIKCHSSWKDNLQLFSDKICSYLKIKSNQTRIDKCGYALVNFSNSIILKFLKRKALELELPILERKWNKINLDHISRSENHPIFVKKIKTMVDKGMRNCEIAKILKVDDSHISIVVSKYNLRETA
jgi:hypothetical protein